MTSGSDPGIRECGVHGVYSAVLPACPLCEHTGLPKEKPDVATGEAPAASPEQDTACATTEAGQAPACGPEPLVFHDIGVDGCTENVLEAMEIALCAHGEPSVITSLIVGWFTGPEIMALKKLLRRMHPARPEPEGWAYRVRFSLKCAEARAYWVALKQIAHGEGWLDGLDCQKIARTAQALYAEPTPNRQELHAMRWALLAVTIADAKLRIIGKSEAHAVCHDAVLQMMHEIEERIPMPTPNSAPEETVETRAMHLRAQSDVERMEGEAALMGEVRALREALEQIAAFGEFGNPSREMKSIARTALAKGD